MKSTTKVTLIAITLGALASAPSFAFMEHINKVASIATQHVQVDQAMVKQYSPVNPKLVQLVKETAKNPDLKKAMTLKAILDNQMQEISSLKAMISDALAKLQ